MRDSVFVLDLWLLVSTNMPLSADILRDYTLKFKIKVEKALTDLRECLREAVRDRDYCREIVDTLMEDIEETSNVQESEITAFRVELDRRGLTLPGIKAECV